jgi:hypothetical protein
MYCGAAQKFLKDATVKDILKLIPDSLLDAKVNIMNSSKFYIHFDMDGNNINIDYRPWPAMYGENSENNSCDKCKSYNKKSKSCGCKGTDCMNYQNLFNNNLKSATASKIKDEEKDTKIDIISDSNDTPIYIAGVPIIEDRAQVINFENKSYTIEENNTFKSENNTEENNSSKEFDILIEAAMKNVLKKMIKSLEE